MADSDAVRTRRRRAHKAGDHRYCRRAVCPDAPEVPEDPTAGAPVQKRVPDRLRVGKPDAGPTVPAPGTTAGPLVEPPREEGAIEKAVIAYVAALKYAETDPRGLLGLICVRIAQRIDEVGAMPAAVKELRAFLQQLHEVPNQEPGFVDEERVRRAAANLDVILAAL